MSLTRMLIFLSIVISIVGGLHFYFWVRLVKDTAMPFPYRPWMGAAIVGLGVSLPLSLILARRLPSAWSAVLAWPAFTWMGVMFLLFVLLLVADFLKVGLHLGSHLVEGQAPSPERRLLLARVLGASAGGAAGVLSVWGIKQAIASLHVKDVVVNLPRLSPAADGTTIVQLTDVHFGPTIGRAYAEEIVRKVNAIGPHVVAITGDLVDGSVEDLRDAVAPLAGLQAKHGVYFVTGNHEYYSGVDPWLVELGRLGIRVLRNERVPIGDFDLVGVDDFKAHGNGHGADLKKALRGRDAGRAAVLLAHQPKAVEEAATMGIDLQISGHTHAGQIWPFNFLVRLAQPFVRGLGRRGDTQIYVSAGTGFWGPPLRIGTQAEITCITLRAGGGTT